ncbi:MATE family efflux transporter [Pararhizobium sp. IMCC21322]|uniref:MATE family efflux transporter n=1 Tax=Pararhizobium sp. IMCC21322 TaxID=3067903 RepID=UPI0027415BEE|nr:MATE family efflux transporter [Pararhizobium sp. IMCC21322]
MTLPIKSWRTHFAQTLSLSVPLVGIQLAQAAIGITDTLMVGRLGAAELAALALATAFFFTLFIVGLGLTQAVLPLAAEAQGAEDPIMLRRTIRMGFWVASGYTILAIAILFNTEAILLFAGQTPETVRFASGYIGIAKWALLPMLMFMNLRAFYTVLDCANIMFAINILGVVANIALNYMFIFGNWGAPELGVEGAAVATLGTATLTLAGMVLLSLYDKRMKNFEIYGRFWRVDTEILRRIIRLGFPIGMTLLAEVGLFAAATILVGRIGTLELAAHGIVMQLASLSFMVPLGLSNVATTRVALAYGRRNAEDLQRAAYATIILAVGFSGAAALVFLAIPTPLISLFLNAAREDTEAVVALAIPYLFLAALFQLVDGTQAVAAGALRGMQDTRMPMVIAIISYWIVGLGSGYVLAFPLGLGGVGVWTGLALGLAVAAILLMARFVMRDRLGLGLATSKL